MQHTERSNHHDPADTERVPDAGRPHPVHRSGLQGRPWQRTLRVYATDHDQYRTWVIAAPNGSITYWDAGNGWCQILHVAMEQQHEAEFWAKLGDLVSDDPEQSVAISDDLVTDYSPKRGCTTLPPCSTTPTHRRKREIHAKRMAGGRQGQPRHPCPWNPTRLGSTARGPPLRHAQLQEPASSQN